MSQASTRPIRARQPQEKLQRREDILRAAEQLWLATSYSATSMQQIARESQLAKGTLYLYFSTKEELFTELLILHLQEWLNDIYQKIQLFAPLNKEAAIELLVHGVPPEPLRRLLVLLRTTLLPAFSEETGQKLRERLLNLFSPLLEQLPFEKPVGLRILKHLYAVSIGWHLMTDSPDPVIEKSRRENKEFEAEFEMAARSVVGAVIDS